MNDSRHANQRSDHIGRNADFVDRCKTETGIELEQDVVLAPYSSIKIGGPAEYFVTVDRLEQMQAILNWVRREQLPYFVLGGGSNVLISDHGMRGLVIHNRCREITFTNEPETDATILNAECGALMAGVARQAVQHSLTGIEWAVSLPGTVGGAVVGNAGAHAVEVKDNLIDARLLMPDGTIQTIPVSDLGFGYRQSRLKANGVVRSDNRPILLDARFRLQPADKKYVQSRATQYLSHRRKSQPVEPSMGSTFRNPPGDYAGRLIESAGLKGARVGGVEISHTHANFIINTGGVGTAKAADVIKLVKLVQSKVENLYDVHLEPEIQLAGDWGDEGALLLDRRQLGMAGEIHEH